jgi:uncharacterized damage-inducible protein DinB
MGTGELFLAELKNEAATTRKMLERVPEDKLDWRPHEKSMTLGRLAGHVAELPGMIRSALTLDELDFAARKLEPFVPKSTAELLATMDTKVSEALELLANQSDEQLRETWCLRNADRIFFELPRAAVVRTMAINHMIHHRGQLSVYLRLLNVPLPSVYGPTADEPMF